MEEKWSHIWGIVDNNEQMTREDYEKGKEWAEKEIKEYQDFIEFCKNKLNECDKKI
jgi:hypothetical protein